MNRNIRSMHHMNLKQRAHEKISMLGDMGVSRDAVYARLGHMLGIKRARMHFSMINDISKLERANTFLSEWIDLRGQKKVNKERRVQYKREIFSDKAVLQEVGRRNTERLLRDSALSTPRYQTPVPLVIQWMKLIGSYLYPYGRINTRSTARVQESV